MGRVNVPTHEELREVLFEYNMTGGYATSDPSTWIKEPDGSTTIPWKSKDGRWRVRDNFFGGEPYGGHIAAGYLVGDGKYQPHWFSGYYGTVLPGEDSKTIYAALRQILRNMPPTVPLRGPSGPWRVGEHLEYTYWRDLQGTIEDFILRERITRGGYIPEVYRAIFVGGLVDQRRGGEETPGENTSVAGALLGRDKLPVGAV